MGGAAKPCLKRHAAPGTARNNAITNDCDSHVVPPQGLATLSIFWRLLP
jgi:hypothetical protein